MKIKLMTAYDPCHWIGSPTGDKIYEWEYVDAKGELKKDKTNWYEKIQSYACQVDYKSRIERGETFENGNAVYLDTTKLGDNPNSISEYLAGIVNDLRQTLQEEITKAEITKTDDKSAETAEEGPKAETEPAGGGA